MASVPAVDTLFSPLDRELGLLPGQLTPLLQEQAVRLGQAVPSFAEAALILESFTHVQVDESTVRRLTQRAGKALLAEETAALAAESTAADGDPVPEKLFLAVDGAMVPLLHGQWREVKTLAIGVPRAAAGLPEERAEQEVVCGALSYFSRLAEAERFRELAGVEMRRRRVPEAQEVAAAADGADWCQGVYDRHRPDAVRILDFPHAAEYVAASGQVLFGAESSVATDWIRDQLHRLKHRGGTEVIKTLRVWQAAVSKAAEKAALEKPLAYLEKRERMLEYPLFRAAGWPIASAIVESANKLVVERRLKGPGMHWAEANVDPMLVLRNAACSQRWEAAWQSIVAARQKHSRDAQPT